MVKVVVVVAVVKVVVVVEVVAVVAVVAVVTVVKVVVIVIEAISVVHSFLSPWYNQREQKKAWQLRSCSSSPQATESDKRGKFECKRIKKNLERRISTKYKT